MRQIRSFLFLGALALVSFKPVIGQAENYPTPAPKTETDPTNILKEIDKNTDASKKSCPTSPATPVTPPKLTVAEKLCRSLPEMKDADLVSKRAFTLADERFIKGLPPDLKKTIKEYKDTMDLLKKAESDMPSELKNNPWLPNNIKIIEKKYPAYAKAKKQFLDLTVAYEAALYAAANEGSTKPDFNIGPDTIRKRATAIAANLKKIAESDKKLSTQAKTEIADRLSNVKVITAATLATEPDTHQKLSLALLFFTGCGKDLKTPNAFAAALPKDEDLQFDSKGKIKGAKPGAKLETIFIVCPALATTAAPLKYKSLGLDFIIAHELSHIITFNRKTPEEEDKDKKSKVHPFGLDQSQLKEQEGLLSCLEKEHGSEFRSTKDVIKILEPIHEAQKLTDPMAGFNSREGSLISQAKVVQKAFEDYLGHEPRKIDTHAHEALADYWATQAIAPDLKNIKGLSFEEATASHMALFCQMQTVSTQEPKDGDEGMHPSYKFRIENFLRHPAFKDDVKASPKVSALTGSWCEL